MNIVVIRPHNLLTCIVIVTVYSPHPQSANKTCEIISSGIYRPCCLLIYHVSSWRKKYGDLFWFLRQIDETWNRKNNNSGKFLHLSYVCKKVYGYLYFRKIPCCFCILSSISLLLCLETWDIYIYINSTNFTIYFFYLFANVPVVQIVTSGHMKHGSS